MTDVEKKEIEGLKKKIEEQVELIETQYVENQTLGNNNAKLLHMYGECQKENEELKAQIEKMKCCGNCINRGLNKDDFSYPCCDCKYWRKIKKNDYWELAE